MGRGIFITKTITTKVSTTHKSSRPHQTILWVLILNLSDKQLEGDCHPKEVHIWGHHTRARKCGYMMWNEWFTNPTLLMFYVSSSYIWSLIIKNKRARAPQLKSTRDDKRETERRHALCREIMKINWFTHCRPFILVRYVTMIVKKSTLIM